MNIFIILNFIESGYNQTIIIKIRVKIHTTTAIAEYHINLKKPKEFVLFMSFNFEFYRFNEL